MAWAKMAVVFWAVLSLLVLLDPRLKEKFDLAKDAASAAKDFSSKRRIQEPDEHERGSHGQ